VDIDRAPISLRFIGHATVLLEVGGIRILTDPFLRRRLGPLERHGKAPDLEALGDIDLVLISHAHADHFDRASLGMLDSKPTVIVPLGLGNIASRWVHGDVREIAVGQNVDLGSVSIEAVPARHWMTPGSPKATPQGYVIDAGARTWFAGDTGRIPELDRIAGKVDVALLPVWTWGPHRGPGHLGPRSAAEVLGQIGARVAVPIHWGTLYPRRLDRVLRGPLNEPGPRFAAHAARLAPEAEVRVLRPGESTVIVPS
jgi:L-ascorbate metabolism protein UlaG (beta-lactamase superfamily)